ncbi:MAG: 50S ribosomal protein L22 [Candidatus Woesearchaeota archaeon]
MKTAYQGNMENCARAVATSIPISKKVGYEIANAVRGKPVAKAIRYLEDVIAMKRAVPYKRYNSDVGHKPGNIAAGRYPIKAAEYILKLIKSAQSNALDKNLDAEILVIKHISVTHGQGQMHHGRQSRRKMKSSNVDVIVGEDAEFAEKASTKATKTTKKPVAKKTVEKTEKAKDDAKSDSAAETKKEDVKSEAKVEEKVEEKVVEKTEEKVETKTTDKKPVETKETAPKKEAVEESQ